MDHIAAAGDRMEVEITTVAYGGMGLGRKGNMVVFVPFTMEGDTVEVEISEVKKRYLKGVPLKILSPAPERIEPRCPYFGICGGCDYQHMPYSYQLEIKERQVLDSMLRIGSIVNPSIERIVPSSGEFNYRTKAEFHVRNSEEGPPKIGFMAAASNELIEIEGCHIVEDSINEELGRIRKELRASRTSGDQKRCAIWSNVSYRSSRVVERTVKEKVMEVPYNGFFQANGLLVNLLVDKVLEMAELNGGENVLDCYCGSGLFTLFIAPLAKKVLGVEVSRSAVECAMRNVKRAGLENADIICGGTGDVLERTILKGREKVDVVLLDSPREGCGRRVLDRLARIRPGKIVYVSCNPATLARDLRYMAEKGYESKAIQPIDMFPQTKHIETIALMVDVP